MTVSPWSDAARALVGAAFGDPSMRNDTDKIDLQRQQVAQDAKRLLLEEAFNPAKISQAEAAARYSAAQAGNEEFTLSNRQAFANGGSLPYTAPPMSPVSGAGNPAINTPYDQIVPMIDETALMGMTGPTPPGRGNEPPPPPPGAMQPAAEMGFEDMLNGLTTTQAPQGPSSFEEMLNGITSPAAGPAPVMQPAPTMQPAPVDPAVTLETLLSPTVRTMIGAGYMPETSLPDLLLAVEGQNANRGATDPTQRILNTAAGAGNFLSPDQLSASAMGNNLPAADIADRGFETMLPTSIQEFNRGQEDPAFMNYLTMKEAQPGFKITQKDGTVVEYGKGGGTSGALTEAQGRSSLFATRAAIAGANLDKSLATEYGQNLGNIDLQNAVDYVAGMSKPDSAIGALAANAVKSPEGRKMYQAANSFLVGIVRPDSGAALTPDEWLVYGSIFLPMPNDDPATLAQKANDRKVATLGLQGISAGGARQIAELLQARGVQVPEEIEALTIGSPAPTAAGGGGDVPTIDTQEEWNALAPGASYIDKSTGQRATK